MFKLVYVSTAAEHLDINDVHSIVEHAQHKNGEHGITGFLCLSNGVFLQYVEGDESAIRQLMHDISADSRHEVVRVVELGHQEDRNFNDWQMRFLDDYQLGQFAIETMLEGVLLAFRRSSVEEWRAHAMADRLVGRIAELAC